MQVPLKECLYTNLRNKQMGPALAVISAVATVAGTVSSISSQKKAARAQQRQQQLQTQRSQRQAIREAQIRRAQTQATALGAGVTGGSALGGGLSSLSSQLGGSLGFASQMSGLSKEISIASQKSQTAGAIAGLGMTVFSETGGFDKLIKG
jgi:hypothetical protein